jgi:general secretion pathway protein K
VTTPRRPAPRERGFALLLVLWAMALLSLIGTRIAANGRAEAQLAANVRDAAVTETAADGAVQDAAFHLLDASPRRWAADGARRVVAMPGVAVEVRVESEDGKVNPNLVSAALLVALLRQAGADTRSADQIAESIVQWRFPWVRAGMNDPALGAYKAAGLDYGPAGAPFRSLDELGAVLGMTPDLLARLRPNLSLFAGGDPDPAAASPAVLAAMRATSGGASVAAAGERTPPNVVGVTAVAAGPNGTRFARHAVLRLGRDRGAEPAEILAWDTPRG